MILTRIKNIYILFFLILLLCPIKNVFAETYIDEAVKRFYDADFDMAVEIIEKSVKQEVNIENKKIAYAYLALLYYITGSVDRADDTIIKLLKTAPYVELEHIETLRPGFLEDATEEFKEHFKSIKSSTDVLLPDGEITGISPVYEQGETVGYTIQANDNKLLKKIIFEVKNSPVKEIWNISGQSATRKSYFITKNWKSDDYEYLLLIEDMADNKNEYTGSFQLKGAESESPQTEATFDSIVMQLKALGKDNNADFIQFRTNKKTLRIGEDVSYHFQSKKDCYLTLLNLTVGGELIQVFPNSFTPNPLVKGNKKYSVPDAEIDLVLKVTGPPGIEKIIALVSETPLNLLNADFEDQYFFEIDKNNQKVLNKIRKNIQKADNFNFAQKQIQYSIR